MILLTFRKMCQLRYIILLLFVAPLANAQQYIDLAKIHYANTPLNQSQDNSFSTRIQEVGFDLTVPFPLENGNAIITGLYLENIQTQVTELSGPTNVYTINPRAGMNIQHNDKWTGTYIVLPKLASDMKNMSSKHYQVGAVALLKYKKKENLNFKAGLYYNSELYGPLFTPLFGLYFLSENKKFEANLTLPIKADASYKLTNALSTGIEFNALVRSYFLGNSYYSGNGEYLTKASNELFSYLRLNITPSIILNAKVGYSIGRSYRVYNIDDSISAALLAFKFGDNRNQLNTDFDNGLIFKFDLIYRFHIDNE